MIICSKQNLLNPNGFRLGVPGSGKSMGAKAELAFIAITTEDDILVCDPENEYGALAEALGGQRINISAGSPHRINAMDMVEGYGDSKNPVVDKSEFILSVFEQLDKNHSLSVIDKGIIDCCVKRSAVNSGLELSEANQLWKHSGSSVESMAPAFQEWPGIPSPGPVRRDGSCGRPAGRAVQSPRSPE